MAQNRAHTAWLPASSVSSAQEQVRNASLEMLGVGPSPLHFHNPSCDTETAKIQEPLFWSEQGGLLPSSLLLINTDGEPLTQYIKTQVGTHTMQTTLPILHPQQTLLILFSFLLFPDTASPRNRSSSPDPWISYPAATIHLPSLL